ncbi:hypothetical protein [Pelistega ratti]|uniref:hypothetical protein n=1 Tax=Pelistega ratti TaxID=2652177 RepID=UPI00135941B6
MISLLEARIKASELKQLIIDGIDPKQHDKATLQEKAREQNKDKYTFKAIALEWLEKHSYNVGNNHYKK